MTREHATAAAAAAAAAATTTARHATRERATCAHLCPLGPHATYIDVMEVVGKVAP